MLAARPYGASRDGPILSFRGSAILRSTRHDATSFRLQAKGPRGVATFGRVVVDRARIHSAASTSQMGRFETHMHSRDANAAVSTEQNGAWADPPNKPLFLG